MIARVAVLVVASRVAAAHAAPPATGWQATAAIRAGYQHSKWKLHDGATEGSASNLGVEVGGVYRGWLFASALVRYARAFHFDAFDAYDAIVHDASAAERRFGVRLEFAACRWFRVGAGVGFARVVHVIGDLTHVDKGEFGELDAVIAAPRTDFLAIEASVGVGVIKILGGDMETYGGSLGVRWRGP